MSKQTKEIQKNKKNNKKKRLRRTKREMIELYNHFKQEKLTVTAYALKFKVQTSTLYSMCQNPPHQYKQKKDDVGSNHKKKK